MPRSKLLLLGKYEDPALATIRGWLAPTFDVVTHTAPLLMPCPVEWIISYRYHHKIPAECLIPNAINFHPGPYSHRGVGAPDWALYSKARGFGVTAHYMTAEIDAGPIIDIRPFDIWPTDTVATLNQRAHAHLLALASDVLQLVVQGMRPATHPNYRWEGPLHTRKQLDALCAAH